MGLLVFGAVRSTVVELAVGGGRVALVVVHRDGSFRGVFVHVGLDWLE